MEDDWDMNNQDMSALLDPNLRLSPDGQADAGNGTASAARDGSTNAPQDRHIYALLQQRVYRGPAMSSARDASMEADPGTATGSQDAKLWTSSKEKLKQEISAIKNWEETWPRQEFDTHNFGKHPLLVELLCHMHFFSEM